MKKDIINSLVKTIKTCRTLIRDYDKYRNNVWKVLANNQLKRYVKDRNWLI